MLFNSYVFIFFFLPLTWFIYFYLNSKKLTELSKGFLVFSSLFFYSWWNITYLPLILISMVFNYTIGSSLAKNSKNNYQKKIIILGIVANLSLLGYFKYADFFIENINLINGSEMGLLHLALPLAISFFTFQQISYLVDSYRQETKEYDFLNYALFVTFFPQLIAGPIVHHKEMMPQFAKARNKVKNYNNIAMGLFIFSIGLFKKVVIADTFALWANTGFNSSTLLPLIEAWATSLSYTFQIYFDFSGYTDMAIGIALIFNIKLPINFYSPYKALDIQDFWRRWHITLSRFLRDYVYIPLGGSRNGNFRTYTNLMGTFIIGGLWHGAGWTFIFWGFLHGIALVIYRIWKKLGFKMNIFIAWFITFNFINISWVFFRAKEWEDAILLLESMFGFNDIVLPAFFIKYNFLNNLNIHFGGIFANLNTNFEIILWLLFAFILIFLKNSIQLLKNISFNRYILTFIIMIFMISIINLNQKSDFLYFNF